jgi:hypothetical protein
LRTLAVLAGLVLLSCTPSPQSSGSPAPVISATPSVLNPADSKAADFRTRLDLLLGEHVIIIAKESAAPSRPAEYTGYLRLLTANGNDLTELVRSALGDSAALHFDQIWKSQNDFLVSYTIGVVTHNKAKADTAMSSIAGTFIPQFSHFLNDVTQIPTDLIVSLLTQQMLEMRAMLDDQFTKNYPRLYTDLRTSYAHAAQVGDALAPKLTGSFPDKFPGRATGPAADLRVSLNLKWQEHAYLTTMRTSAAIGGRSAEQAAAAGALGENANTLDALFTDLFGAPIAKRFDAVWAASNAATIGYASASTPAAKQRSLSQLNDALVTQLAVWIQDSTDLTSSGSRPALEAQFDAVAAVIDDQRARSLSKLAADDRSAETSTEVVADLVVAAIVAKLHARFGA